jgi:hypothetical protein
MADVTEAVLLALSARDINSFISCYAEDARIENGDGVIMAAGRDAIRRRYELMFQRFPRITARKIRGFSVGSYVVQEEEVQGREPEPERHIAVYRVAHGLIAHERLLR